MEHASPDPRPAVNANNHRPGAGGLIAFRFVGWGGSVTPTTATTAITAPAATTVAAPTTASAATTASTAAAAVTTSTSAVFTGLGLVHRQSTAVMFAVVEAIDGRLRLGLGIHLDEAEAFAPAGVAVLDHLGTLDGSELREQLLKLRAVNLVGQIPDIQLLAHRWSPGRRKDDPLETFRVEEKGAKGLPNRWEGEGESGTGST